MDLKVPEIALEYFRKEVKKAGFKGLHIQAVGNDSQSNPILLRGDLAEGKDINGIISVLGFNSITMYNMANRSKEYVQDYIKYGEEGRSLMGKWDSILTIPFFPCVSVGWDNVPRHPGYGKEEVCHYHNTPESFGAFLLKAKEYVDSHPEQPKLIVINAWNEWVEGSYLEPDMKWGYGYLEAVKKVMSGKYDKYTNQTLQKRQF